MTVKKDAVPVQLAQSIAEHCLKQKPDHLERVWSGVSTYVYRIRIGENTVYLRILPEEEMSFGVEVTVHNALIRQGIQVPEVVCFERVHDAVGLSVMLVNEIPGSSIEACPPTDKYEDVLVDAGKQLAVINRMPVDGFGWIRRGKDEEGTALRGEKSAIRDVISEADEHLFALSEFVLSEREALRIKSMIGAGTPLMARYEPSLAHGDFDVSHIFHRAGKYTGIIDFGEIQGGSPLYDLGHFRLHDGQGGLPPGFDFLAKGYAEVTPLTLEDRLEIELWALWIGVRRLGNACKKKRNKYQDYLIRSIERQTERIKHQMQL